MKVLFVEDSDFYLHFRRGFFTRMGCFILNARSAGLALETVESEKPDLLVVSSRLPDGSGADLCQRIRRQHPRRPPRIILISEPGDAHGGTAAWDDHLVRPVDPEDLMARIAVILNVQQRRFPRMPVQVQVVYGSRRDRLAGTTRDLSPEGMLIESATELDRGTRLQLEFTLPGQAQVLRTDAEVVRTTRLGSARKHGLGVRFVGAPAAVRETILAFLG